MAAPRKYPEELRERAIRMAVDARRDPAARPGAVRRVAEQLGINPETLRGWVKQAEIDDGHRPGTSTADAQRLLERTANTHGRRLPCAVPVGGMSRLVAQLVMNSSNRFFAGVAVE